MQAILKLVDYLWNIKFIKGYRSLVARSFLIGVSAYQSFASLKAVHDILPIPVIPIEAYGLLTAYFGLKLEQFASEHK